MGDTTAVPEVISRYQDAHDRRGDLISELVIAP
jgi:hypothetical protein